MTTPVPQDLYMSEKFCTEKDSAESSVLGRLINGSQWQRLCRISYIFFSTLWNLKNLWKTMKMSSYTLEIIKLMNPRKPKFWLHLKSFFKLSETQLLHHKLSVLLSVFLLIRLYLWTQKPELLA